MDGAMNFALPIRSTLPITPATTPTDPSARTAALVRSAARMRNDYPFSIMRVAEMAPSPVSFGTVHAFPAADKILEVAKQAKQSRQFVAAFRKLFPDVKLPFGSKANTAKAHLRKPMEAAIDCANKLWGRTNFVKADNFNLLTDVFGKAVRFARDLARFATSAEGHWELAEVARWVDDARFNDGIRSMDFSTGHIPYFRLFTQDTFMTNHPWAYRLLFGEVVLDREKVEIFAKAIAGAETADEIENESRMMSHRHIRDIAFGRFRQNPRLLMEAIFWHKDYAHPAFEPLFRIAQKIRTPGSFMSADMSAIIKTLSVNVGLPYRAMREEANQGIYDSLSKAITALFGCAIHDRNVSFRMTSTDLNVLYHLMTCEVPEVKALRDAIEAILENRSSWNYIERDIKAYAKRRIDNEMFEEDIARLDENAITYFTGRGNHGKGRIFTAATTGGTAGGVAARPDATPTAGSAVPESWAATGVTEQQFMALYGDFRVLGGFHDSPATWDLEAVDEAIGRMDLATEMWLVNFAMEGGINPKTFSGEATKGEIRRFRYQLQILLAKRGIIKVEQMAQQARAEYEAPEKIAVEEAPPADDRGIRNLDALARKSPPVEAPPKAQSFGERLSDLKRTMRYGDTALSGASMEVVNDLTKGADSARLEVTTHSVGFARTHDHREETKFESEEALLAALAKIAADSSALNATVTKNRGEDAKEKPFEAVILWSDKKPEPKPAPQPEPAAQQIVSARPAETRAAPSALPAITDDLVITELRQLSSVLQLQLDNFPRVSRSRINVGGHQGHEALYLNIGPNTKGVESRNEQRSTVQTVKGILDFMEKHWESGRIFSFRIKIDSHQGRTQYHISYRDFDPAEVERMSATRRPDRFGGRGRGGFGGFSW